MALKTTNSITITGTSEIEGIQAVYLSATISQEIGGASTVSQNITNKELYNENKVECRKDIADFQDHVYELEDQYSKSLGN
ncbi:hypothetical protein I6N95_04960 [Vagococcus sp. BWB3-3]|uniref:Uncharacterized protein n=1 Tax=Vagococcus allomyrinae TaxID=2794353 RepID=A0A940P8F9_9ENTE|nr:hypothetical protein [Vagococcus allomyrinae]MBP1040359.1 hypothetical protein [Vagococcus allomyrinae]